MLDPRTRKEFLCLCEDLRKKYNLTFVNITHHMEEALLADYIYVLDEGEIKLEGTSKEIFARRDLVEKYGLLLPFATDFYQNLVSETKKIFAFLESELGFTFTSEEEKEASKLGFDANFRDAVHKDEIEKNIIKLTSLWQGVITRVKKEASSATWDKFLEFLSKRLGSFSNLECSRSLLNSEGLKFGEALGRGESLEHGESLKHGESLENGENLKHGEILMRVDRLFLNIPA